MKLWPALALALTLGTVATLGACADPASVSGAGGTPGTAPVAGTASATGSAPTTIPAPTASAASTRPAPTGTPTPTRANPTPAPTHGTPVPATSPAAKPPPIPAFHGTSAAITARDVPRTWHSGCPVGPSQLRELTMSYWGFDRAPHTGVMIVNRAVASDVLTIFKKLYDAHFPVRKMQPVDAYGGSDPKSMADDNTSGFNCRLAVTTGPASWSVHAYGEAIDINTVENPYLEAGQVMPAAGRPYLVRSPYRAGMAVKDGVLVKAFASVGWKWGGRWSSSPDYQHFSKTGG